MAVSNRRRKAAESLGKGLDGPAGPRLEQAFPNPFNDRRILAYYRQLHYWHGFIRFLGLPHLKDNPDVPIDRLFVSPELAEHPLPPDPPREGGPQRRDLLATLAHYPRLVVLGDPGSGKSTLVSWVAWALSRSSKGAWVEKLGLRVPLPMVVRELELAPELGWDGLLDAFLTRPVADDLDRDVVEALLTRGQAFLILDGVDEIASVARRKALRAAVIEGVERYPNCRWLVTSRLVGYDRVPFHRLPEDEEAESTATAAGDLPEGLEPRDRELRWAEVVYVTPFSDRQIERFAHNWYRRYETAAAQGGLKAQELVQAIHGNARTLRLARVPNLLTLMALIHRIQARLPHGRAVLYGKIVDAYLESIDAYRGIQEVDYSLEEKKRWLAWVGFRMQRRRSLETEAREEHKEREILVDEADLLTWLEEAMARSPRALDVAEPGTAARAFVDYIARRSGLLLPRGEGRYAFTHLSFQEFFAALHLEARITSPRWFEKPQPEEGDGPDNVRAYANYDAWREPLVLLFGLLAGRPEWAEELAELIFGEGFSDLCEDENGRYACKARLLAEVSADPHAGLPGDQRERAWTCSWRWELSQQQRLGDLGALVNHDPVIARTLLSCDVSDEVGIWRSFQNSYKQEGVSWLNMNNIGAFRDLGHLSALSELLVLSASGSSIKDLSPLAMLNKLEFLWLHFTDVKDLRPLSKVSSLRLLGISSTTVSNLTPLARLQNLQYLYLHDTAVGDLSPLADLRKLEALGLARSKVTELGPLRRVKSLRILMADHTSIDSLKPIESLTGVEVLGLSWASVNDFAPLCGLFNLRILDVSGTQFEDLGLLVGLDNLTDLVLAETRVTSLRPLANLSRLVYLELAGTSVEDISPLARLTSLRKLGLSRTKVTDLEPLAHLDGLDYLDLRNTKIDDVRAISKLRDNVEIVGGPKSTSTR